MNETLRKLREQAGLSGYSLAKKAGITSTAYYQLDPGTSKPTYGTLLSLSRVLASELRREPGEVLAELTGVNEPTQPKKELA